MLFTLEALKAKKGDCLLLHAGPEDKPELIVIDGGPSGVYRQSLLPRLRAIHAARDPDAGLPIRMLMVSHIDDDHIRGVLDLTDKLIEQRDDRQEEDFRITTLWHNSFDDIVGNRAETLFTAARSEVGAAALAGEPPPNVGIAHSSALMLASVPQGRQLRDNAAALGIEVNQPGGGLIADPGSGPAVSLVEGLETRVLGPRKQRVDEFQAEWDEILRKKGLAVEQGTLEAAEYLDKSVYNLASIIVLMRAGDKEMLLTGDARGDDILTGLRGAKLLDADGHRHVDLLKMPHHGSDRNIETDFFRAVSADHYVFSGDGSYGNPEVATFQMLFAAREEDDRPFTIHLTYPPEQYRANRGRKYPVAKLRAVFDEARQAGQCFEVKTPASRDVSIKIDLLDSYMGP
jgi:hypothetical protein